MRVIDIIPRHILIAASSWLSRGVSTIVQIMSVRYLVEILGQDKYAAFILLSGIIAWCNLSDFGLGNSILSFISEKRARNKKYAHMILSCVLILFLFFLLTCTCLYFTSGFISDFYLKNFDKNIIANKEQTFFLASIIFCLASFGGVVYKIWYAEQVGWLSNLYPAIASVIGLVGIYYIAHAGKFYDYDVVSVFIIFYFPASLIAVILLMIKIYKLKSFNFDFSKNIKIIKILLKRARPYFLFSVMGVIVLQTDYIVLSQKLKAEDIILYGVLMKIFNVIYFIYSSVLQAWWPVCTELRVQKKWKELRQGILISVILGAVAIIGLGLVVYFTQNLIFDLLNLHDVKRATLPLFALLILYFVIRVWCDTFAVLLHTMNYMRPLFVIVPVQVILNLAFQWYFATYWGLYGILVGLIASFILTVAIYLPWQFSKQVSLESNIK